MTFCKSMLSILTLLGCTVVAAGPITWEDPLNSSGPGDVLTAGELVEALNASSSAAASVDVNEVTFDNISSLPPLSNIFSNALNGTSTGDAGYNALLGSFAFGGGTSVSLSLGGGTLGVGKDYLLQIWFTDLRTNTSSRDMIYGDGQGNNVVLNASAGGLGQYAVGRFTADGASQTLTLETVGFANTHISAYQLRDVSTAVPLPSSVGLLGLALLILGVTKRRR